MSTVYSLSSLTKRLNLKCQINTPTKEELTITIVRCRSGELRSDDELIFS